MALGSKDLTTAEVRAKNGQFDEMDPMIRYPNPHGGGGGEPQGELTSFLARLTSRAIGRPLVDEADELPPIVFFDDFFAYDPTATVGGYVVVEDAGATAPDVIADGVGGWLSVGCDGDDNDECYVASVNQCFKFAADKPLYFEARIKLTEANTNDANWCIGLSDVAAANTLVDNGGGIVASFDGALFYKVDGTMEIMFNTSNAATQGTAESLATFVSAQWYRVGFIFDPADGTTGTITPYLDGVAGTAQDITLAGLEEMNVLMGLKAGDTNEEAFIVDYVRVIQKR